MFVSIKSQTSLEMGYIESKTRSLHQILEKNCVGSRGHMFSLMHMKLSQTVCLDQILYEFKNGSSGVKTRSLGQFLENLVYRLEATFSI